MMEKWRQTIKLTYKSCNLYPIKKVPVFLFINFITFDSKTERNIPIAYSFQLLCKTLQKKKDETSIRYARERDKEKREREREREKEKERENYYTNGLHEKRTRIGMTRIGIHEFLPSVSLHKSE